MSTMFSGWGNGLGTILAGTIDLSYFDTSKVENMTSMFSGCNALKTIDLSTFDVSSNTSISNMFNGCIAFGPTLDLRYWKTPNLANAVNFLLNANQVHTLYLNSADFTTTTLNTFFFNNNSTIVDVYVGNTATETWMNTVKGSNNPNVTIHLDTTPVGTQPSFTPPTAPAAPGASGTPLLSVAPTTQISIITPILSATPNGPAAPNAPQPAPPPTRLPATAT
jgi:surface protein